MIDRRLSFQSPVEFIASADQKETEESEDSEKTESADSEHSKPSEEIFEQIAVKAEEESEPTITPQSSLPQEQLSIDQQSKPLPELDLSGFTEAERRQIEEVLARAAGGAAGVVEEPAGVVSKEETEIYKSESEITESNLPTEYI